MAGRHQPALLVHNASPAALTARALRKSGRYGGASQRAALLRLVREARLGRRVNTLEEAKGLVHGFHEMRRIGYSLEDVSLAYRGRQGVDAVFSRMGPSGKTHAILESKHGYGLSSLKEYRGALRQGASGYIQSRLTRYLLHGNGQYAGLASHLLAEQTGGRLESFASFYRWNRLYQLPSTWPVAAAIRR